MRGGGQKMSFFVHAQDIKTVHAGWGGVKKWENSVHVVVECPLTGSDYIVLDMYHLRNFFATSASNPGWK